MMKSVWGALAALAVLASASTAAAEVVARTADSFTLRYEVGAEIDPSDIPGALVDVGRWWDSDHTYSGDAANITVDLTPGGCWCEKLADGTQFEHGRVVSIAPDRIVFDAPFGPLKGKATKAVLTVTWPPANAGWTPTWEMVVEGPGLGAMADGVDGVMGAGFQRWLRYLERGDV
ncbi:hypothetical protein [Brevundimonas sp. Root1279]|uniref:hypothetical protein n=1 Tax=Brevundimonas sp. Root1279 TaxID=1736443 RepID=UPI0007001264|nr:hypothetical protein [Brevundimonas sp. Root1279]KQW86363.1 hypothetical protein ASC65_00165 [Brevundimonas sp. Root1279]